MYRILLCLFFLSVLQLVPGPKKLLLVYAPNELNPTLQTKHIQALQQLAKENNFTLNTARIGSPFTEKNLKKYDALVFLNPANELLNTHQRPDLERYIQAGGGLLQISLSPPPDTNWPWYTRLQEAGLKAKYVKSFQVPDKDQLRYWHTAFDGGFYSQITLTDEKQSFLDSDWFEFLPDELNYVTNHPPLNYRQATTPNIP